MLSEVSRVFRGGQEKLAPVASRRRKPPEYRLVASGETSLRKTPAADADGSPLGCLGGVSAVDSADFCS